MEKSSQEIVASINDLLTEILLRLPVKSLIRFKQVSKHWQSLISDPGFGFRHKPIPSPAVGMFVHRSFVTTISRYISFSNEKPTNKLVEKLNGVDIIQSCNGLLLCSSSLTKPKYFVYNPTTNKSSTFPYGGGTKEWGVKGMSLAFDPARSCHFKIVRVRKRYMVKYEYRFEVYSSENGCWRKPDGLFRSRFKFKNGVYWNGAIHWINHKINNMTRECLYFNPDDDDPMVMPRMAPSISVPGSDYNKFYFGESCGHLNYMEFCRPDIRLNVYELKRDYSEWFVKYRVDLSIIYRALDYTKKHGDFDWTMLVRGEKDEDSFMVVVYSGNVIVRYNFVQGTCETICDLRDYKEIKFCKGFQYIESLCAF